MPRGDAMTAIWPGSTGVSDVDLAYLFPDSFICARKFSMVTLVTVPISPCNYRVVYLYRLGREYASCRCRPLLQPEWMYPFG